MNNRNGKERKVQRF